MVTASAADEVMLVKSCQQHTLLLFHAPVTDGVSTAFTVPPTVISLAGGWDTDTAGSPSVSSGWHLTFRLGSCQLTYNSQHALEHCDR